MNLLLSPSYKNMAQVLSKFSPLPCKKLLSTQEQQVTIVHRSKIKRKIRTIVYLDFNDKKAQIGWVFYGYWQEICLSWK